MTAEYPRRDQNPPYDEGERPVDQESPRVRVPDAKTSRRDAPSNDTDLAHVEDTPTEQGHRESHRDGRGT